MAEAIRLEGLTKDYDDNRALDHLDLNVSTEGCVGFLGPNGAGKTTTIKILTNMLKPTDVGPSSSAWTPSMILGPWPPWARWWRPPSFTQSSRPRKP